MEKITKEYLKSIYATSEIPVLEPDKDERMKENVLGYYDPNVPEILIRKKMSNEKKLYIFYHEYKHHMQERRYTEWHISCNKTKMEYEAEIYAGNKLLKSKAVDSLFCWKDNIFEWLFDGEKYDYLSEAAELVINNPLWNKVAKFIRSEEMFELKNSYD